MFCSIFPQPPVMRRFSRCSMKTARHLKLIATCTTLGSGASGGIFSPSLFLGVAAGGLFGQCVHALFPASTASPAAYAMIGMGAVVAGTTHAPVTAILMLFEFFLNYLIANGKFENNRFLGSKSPISTNSSFSSSFDFFFLPIK